MIRTYEEWKAQQTDAHMYESHAKTFKGYATGPVIIYEDETIAMCSRRFDSIEELDEYDFSECFLLEYLTAPYKDKTGKGATFYIVRSGPAENIIKKESNNV